MTTQTEALKLALEALEKINEAMPFPVGSQAITAIKEALQSNEQVKPTCWITPDGEGFRMRMTPPVNDVPLGWMPLFDHPPVPYVTPSRTAQPKEPEQEPVAKIKRNSAGQIYIEWRDGEGAITSLIGAEFYTTQPQRKPLTDEQIDAAIRNSKKVDTGYAGWVRDQRREFARAIEAAHGIKGD